MITIDELIEKLSAKGYAVTKSKLAYYTRKGLLPEPQKRGERRGGVKSVYPDTAAAMDRVETIFALKTKGHSLAEIKQTLETDALEQDRDQARQQLKRYVEKDGRCYRRLNKAEFDGHYRTASDLLVFNEILFEESSKDIGGMRIGGVCFNDRHLAQIQDRSLFVPVYLYRNQEAYEVSGHGYEAIKSWGYLHTETGLDWQTLGNLHRQHRENLDRHLFYPQPDGVQASEAFNGWQRQQLLNGFGTRMKAYFISMRRGFAPAADDPPELAWDAGYPDADAFVKDFLAGQCAFVPVLTGSPQDAPDIRVRICLRRF